MEVSGKYLRLADKVLAPVFIPGRAGKRIHLVKLIGKDGGKARFGFPFINKIILNLV